MSIKPRRELQLGDPQKSEEPQSSYKLGRHSLLVSDYNENDEENQKTPTLKREGGEPDSSKLGIMFHAQSVEN